MNIGDCGNTRKKIGLRIGSCSVFVMRALPTTFKRHGFTYTQVVNLHPAYVYEQRKGSRVWYEAIKARKTGARELNGRALEAAWQFPKSEDWGAHGFTCQTLKRAMERAQQLQQRCI